MDPAAAVTTNVFLALTGFAGIIALLLFLIARWKWHVFFALLIPMMLFGIIPGVRQNNFITAFENGFGNTLGSIGVVIVLGSIIAEALKHTGAIQVITKSMVNLVGTTRMPLALTLTGFILGIAIFSDVAYVILNPLVHSAAHMMKVSMGVMATGLVGAIQLTHAIVPPTPGPLAAAPRWPPEACHGHLDRCRHPRERELLGPHELGIYRMAFLVRDIRASVDALRAEGGACPEPACLDMGPDAGGGRRVTVS